MVNAASALKEQTLNIEQNDDGWEVRLLPPAKIDMMRLRIPAERFEGNEKGEMFAVDAVRLQKALNVCGDVIDLTVTDRVTVKGEGVKMVIPRIDPETVNKFPALDGLDTEVVMSSDELRRMSDASPDDAVSMTISVNAEGVVMVSADDISVSSAEIGLPADKCVMCEGEAKGTYAWLPLRGFLKGIPKGGDVDVRMAENYPMVIRFETEGGLTGEYMLAPWIVEE